MDFGLPRYGALIFSFGKSNGGFSAENVSCFGSALIIRKQEVAISMLRPVSSPAPSAGHAELSSGKVRRQCSASGVQQQSILCLQTNNEVARQVT